MTTNQLHSAEITNAKNLLGQYFNTHRGQEQLDEDTDDGVRQQLRFTSVLLEDATDERGFRRFLQDEIWAIHENLHLGVLTNILEAHPVPRIRAAFRAMLEGAPSSADPDSALALGKIDFIGTSILSEALAKVFPDRFSIKNKRSEWALFFILQDRGPHSIEEMSYGAFINIAWKVWDLLRTEYDNRGLRLDPNRRLWYVDRFYLWIYLRPETKQIMKASGA